MLSDLTSDASVPQAETAVVVTVMTVVRRVVAAATAGAAATAMGRAAAVVTAGAGGVVAIAVQAVGGVSVPSLPETGISFAPPLSTQKDSMFLKRRAY